MFFMTIPSLSPEQRRKALEKAQQMRRARAELRNKLKAGEITLEEVFNNKESEVITKMRVSYLLESMPHVGKVTCKKIMDEIGIDESRRVQGLGERQKAELLKRLK